MPHITTFSPERLNVVTFISSRIKRKQRKNYQEFVQELWWNWSFICTSSHSMDSI